MTQGAVTLGSAGPNTEVGGAQGRAVSVVGTGASGGAVQAITVALGDSAVVPLVAEHGIWKITSAWICALAGPHRR